MSDALHIRYLPIGELHESSKRNLVRYADDFVVLCETKEDAEKAIEDLKPWLTIRGLQLSEEKTRIVHITEGFDFLSYKVRQYKANDRKTGWILLIKPSKEAIRALQKKLKEKWKALKGKSPEDVIRELNPIIRGWANYHRINTASQVFAYLDHWNFRHEVKWAKRKHRNKGWKWLKKRYWSKLNKSRNDNWCFGDKTTGAYLDRFAWHNIKRHVLVKGNSSPDDPGLKDYWKKREAKKSDDLQSSLKRQVARQQDHVCTNCGDSIHNGEDIHRHQIVPKGGYTTDNVQLVHEECHKQIHKHEVKPKELA
jgi:RNA-directed DNA polymerase